MSDELNTGNDIEEMIDEIRENYPLISEILDRVPEMDIEEAGTVSLLLDGVRMIGKAHALRLLKIEDKSIPDEIIELKISETKLKYPLFGYILERIHNMDLKETYTGLLVLDGLEHILKARQLEILREKGINN